MDCIKIVHDNIIINGYAESPKWLGFTEMKSSKVNYYHRISCMIKDFIEKFYSENDFVNIVYSLAYDYSVDIKITERQKTFFSWIDKIFEIKILKTQQDWDYYENKMQFKLTYSNISLSVLHRLLWHYYTNNRLNGHVFIFLPNKHVIAYAHVDDIGFGFISYDSCYNNVITEYKKLKNLPWCQYVQYRNREDINCFLGKKRFDSLTC